MEYQRKEVPVKIGRIKLDIADRKGEKYVVLMPDPNQSPDGIIVSKNFINDTFLKDKSFKIGMTSFPEEQWRKSQGRAQEFIDGIKRSKVTISWTDASKDKKIMKGIEALVPKIGGGFAGASPGDISAPGMGPSLAGGMKPGGGGGGGMGGLSSPMLPITPGLGGQAVPGMTPPGSGPMGSKPGPANTPLSGPSSKPENFDMNDMKVLLELWDKHKNAI